MVTHEERRAGITLFESIHWLQYLRAKYHVDVELHVALEEDGEARPICCITGVGKCGKCGHMRVFTYNTRTLEWNQVGWAEKTFYEMMYEFNELVDGEKQLCVECELLDYPF